MFLVLLENIWMEFVSAPEGDKIAANCGMGQGVGITQVRFAFPSCRSSGRIQSIE